MRARIFRGVNSVAKMDVPEGLEELDTCFKLGVMTAYWPEYELMWFNIFEELLAAPLKNAMAVWFNLTSLDVRLKLIETLGREPDVLGGERLRKATKRGRELASVRNVYVHGIWEMDDDANRMRVVFNARKRVQHPVDGHQIQEFVENVQAHTKELLEMLGTFRPKQT